MIVEDSEMIIELWSSVINFVPNKERSNAAFSFLSAFQGLGVDLNDLDDLHGHDTYLDKALEELSENHEEDEDHWDESE